MLDTFQLGSGSCGAVESIHGPQNHTRGFQASECREACITATTTDPVALFRAAPISGRGCTKERFCNLLAPDGLSRV